MYKKQTRKKEVELEKEKEQAVGPLMRKPYS